MFLVQMRSVRIHTSPTSMAIPGSSFYKKGTSRVSDSSRSDTTFDEDGDNIVSDDEHVNLNL